MGVKERPFCRFWIGPTVAEVLELSVRWYTVVYILDVYIECLPRVS